MGWGDQEQLAVVLDDGTAFMYTIHGVLITKFSVFGEPVSNTSIVECHFWGNGCVAVGSDMQLYSVEVV